VETHRRAGTDENIPISRRRPDIVATKNGRRSVWEIKPIGDTSGTLTYSFDGDGMIHYSIDDGEGIRQQSPNFNFVPTTESVLQKSNKNASRFVVSGSIIMTMALILLAF
jgi:hypothetical protein